MLATPRSATFKGDAIGTVATGGRQYTATGNVRLDWNFRSRTGDLNISKFDRNKSCGKMAYPT
jgi:hypothetical protein